MQERLLVECVHAGTEGQSCRREAASASASASAAAGAETAWKMVEQPHPQHRSCQCDLGSGGSLFSTTKGYVGPLQIEPSLDNDRFGSLSTGLCVVPPYAAARLLCVILQGHPCSRSSPSRWGMHAKAHPH